MIKRIWCFFTGHKRGKRVSTTHVECPRCTATWERKEQKKVVAA